MAAQEVEQLMVENTIKVDPDRDSFSIDYVSLTEQPHNDIDIKVGVTCVKQELELDDAYVEGNIKHCEMENFNMKHEKVEIKNEWTNDQSRSMAEDDDTYEEGSLECEEENPDYSTSNSSQQSRTTTSVEGDTKPKRFSCSLCGCKVVTNSNLICHMRIHTGEKPFACNLCDFKTAHQSSLSMHMKVHTGEKPYACNLCDYKAAQKIHLSDHMRIHTGEKPFACHSCDYKAAQKSSLRKHIKLHTGEKPFVCNFCDYKAVHSGHLSRHMKIHTGVKTRF